MNKLRTVAASPVIQDLCLTMPIGVVCWLSIVHQFSNDPTFKHIDNRHFSLGPGHTKGVYFFQLTLWHLWIFVICYVILYNMVFKRLRGKSDEITPHERVVDRIAITMAFTVFMVYWILMSPANMSSYTNAFDLVNTMGCHIVAPLLVLTYFYLKYRRIETQQRDNSCNAIDKPTHQSKFNSFINALNHGNFWPWFFIFSTGIAVFAGLSAASQKWVTSTPVYCTTDWRNGVGTGISFAFCAFILGCAIFNFYLIHNHSKQKLVKGIIFSAIFTMMGVTLFYGFAVQCAGFNWGPLKISNWKPLLTAFCISFGFSIFISIVVVLKILPKVEKYVFPEFSQTECKRPSLNSDK